MAPALTSGSPAMTSGVANESFAPLLGDLLAWPDPDSPLNPALLLALALWLALEVAFYVWYRVELGRAQGVKARPEMSVEDRNFLLGEMLRYAEDYGMWRQVQGWFLAKDSRGTRSPHEVGTDDLHDLIAWAFFYKRVEELDGRETEWLWEVSSKIESDFGLEKCVRPGRHDVEAVRHTLDPIHAVHRPLLFYLGAWSMQGLHGVLLRFRGFRRGRHAGLRYWYRLKSKQSPGAPAEDQDQACSQPLVFFHGIGLGLAGYLPLLLRLPFRDQLLFEMPWISMDPFAAIPSSAEYAQWVAEVLQTHEMTGCVALGHSFGTLPIAWLLRNFPGVIARPVLVDPVAIFLNLPDVCVNFLYKKPHSLTGYVMRCFGAREFGIARALMRHFFWTDSVLFPEMLPADSSVILMGQDRILPVRDIYTSAAKLPHLRTEIIDGLDHGHFLLWPPAIQTIIDHLRCAEPGSVKKPCPPRPECGPE